MPENRHSHDSSTMPESPGPAASGSVVHVEREQAERIRRIAVRRLDHALPPLILVVDAMPRGPERACALSAVHTLFNGLIAIRDEMDDVLKADATVSGEASHD